MREQPDPWQEALDRAGRQLAATGHLAEAAVRLAVAWRRPTGRPRVIRDRADPAGHRQHATDGPKPQAEPRSATVTRPVAESHPTTGPAATSPPSAGSATALSFPADPATPRTPGQAPREAPPPTRPPRPSRSR